MCWVAEIFSSGGSFFSLHFFQVLTVLVLSQCFIVIRLSKRMPTHFYVIWSMRIKENLLYNWLIDRPWERESVRTWENVGDLVRIATNLSDYNFNLSIDFRLRRLLNCSMRLSVSRAKYSHNLSLNLSHIIRLSLSLSLSLFILLCPCITCSSLSSFN